MKKFLYLAVGFLAVFACSREAVDSEQPDVPSIDTTEPIQVTLTTGSVETRTELRFGDGNRLHPFWTSEDDVNVILIPTSTDDLEYYEEDDYSYFVNPENHFGITLLENGAQAEFTGTVPSAGDYLAFYPRLVLGENEYGEEYPVSGAYSDVYVDDDYIEGNVYFEVPSVQRPTSTSFDPTADLLISTPFEITTTQPTTVETSFTRMNAIVKLVLVNQTGIEGFDNQEVRRVSIGTSYISSGGDEGGDYYGAPALRNRTSGRTRASVYDSDEDGEHYNSDRGLAGRVEYRFGKDDNGFWDYYYLDDARRRSVTAEYDESSAYTIGESGENGTATYLIVVPGILKNDEWEYDGESIVDGLHLRVETDGYVIERNVKLPSGGIALQPSSVTTLQIGLYPDGVKETTIWEKGFSFFWWDSEEDEYRPVNSLSVKEDTYEELMINLVGLTLDRYEWKNDLQVSCDPAGHVRVDFEDAEYEDYSDRIYGVNVWGDQVTDSPVTVTFSAGGCSSSFEVNVVKANTPASISLGDGVTRIDLDQYDALSLNATITPDDPDEPLDVNYDKFACKLIDSNGSEGLISGAAFEESGSGPSEMVITLPAISEAGEFNLEITYKEASLLTIPFKVWAGADLPVALQNWKGPSRNYYLSLYYYDPVLSWFEEYRNQYNQLKTYKASQLTELLHYAFAGAFKSSDKPGNFDAFQYFTGITEISEMAFGDCTYMQGITLPDNIESIGANAFGYCRSLESIVLPEGLATIGEDAFASCSSLSSIVFPRSVSLIDDGAFQSTGLSSVTFSEGIALTTLHFNVFRETPNLKSIDLPSTLTLIESFAFYSSALESIIIPDGVSTIERYAFSDTHLTTVTIPASVTTIEEYAFSGCAMTSAFLLPEVPPTTVGNQAFEPKVLYDEDGQPYQNKYPIYVSDGSYEAYRTAAANWMASGPYNNIVDRIKKMSEVPAQ